MSYDPAEDTLYLTEDNFAFPSGFYRYVPLERRDGHRNLDHNGRLQMLAVVGRPNLHLEAHQDTTTVHDVEWVDIDEPDVEFPYTPGEPAPSIESRGSTAMPRPSATRLTAVATCWHS